MFLETYLPGLIAGILGACCVFAGVILSFVKLGPSTGLAVLTVVSLLSAVGGWAYFTWFPESAMAKRFISYRTVGEIGTEKPELLHRTGVAHSTLRPAGLALIDGKRVDVIAEGAFIERGSPVKVVSIEGCKVVVRAETSPSLPDPLPAQSNSTESTEPK